MVDDVNRKRLMTLYRALADRPLWPEDPAYVDLFAQGVLSDANPIERMATCIEFANLETVQLFSGHRGTGKSTQLHALKRRLENSPVYKVVISQRSVSPQSTCRLPLVCRGSLLSWSVEGCFKHSS